MATYSLKVVLHFIEAEQAARVNRTLLPDAIQVPPNMAFKQEVRGSDLMLYVLDENFNRVRSTTDEILGQCQLIFRLSANLK